MPLSRRRGGSQMMMRGDVLIPYFLGLNSNLIALYPLQEAAGAAIDYSPLKNTGTQDVDNLLAAGSFLGRPCIRMAGNGGVNIAKTSYLNAVNILEFSQMCFFRITDAAVWTDGTERDVWFFANAALSQRGHIYRTTGNRTIGFIADVGAQLNLVTTTLLNASPAWHFAALTSSKSNSEMKAYLDGVQVGTTQTTIGDDLGTAETISRLGERGGVSQWKGDLAFAVQYSGADNGCILTAAQILNIAERTVGVQGFVGSGDSTWTVETTLETRLINDLETVTTRPWRLWGELAVGGLTAHTWRVGDGGSWAGIDAVLAATSYAKAPAWIIVCIGKNDMSSMPTEAAFVADYGYVLDAFAAKWPTAQILIEIPWRSGKDTEANTIAGYLTTIQASRSGFVQLGPDERVYFKPNVATYSSDGIHIDTTTGAQARGDQLAAAMGY